MKVVGIRECINEGFENTGKKMVIRVLLAQYVQNTFFKINAWDVDAVMCVEKF